MTEIRSRTEHTDRDEAASFLSSGKKMISSLFGFTSKVPGGGCKHSKIRESPDDSSFAPSSEVTEMPKHQECASEARGVNCGTGRSTPFSSGPLPSDPRWSLHNNGAHNLDEKSLDHQLSQQQNVDDVVAVRGTRRIQGCSPSVSSLQPCDTEPGQTGTGNKVSTSFVAAAVPTRKIRFIRTLMMTVPRRPRNPQATRERSKSAKNRARRTPKAKTRQFTRRLSHVREEIHQRSALTVETLITLRSTTSSTAHHVKPVSKSNNWRKRISLSASSSRISRSWAEWSRKRRPIR